MSDDYLEDKMQVTGYPGFLGPVPAMNPADAFVSNVCRWCGNPVLTSMQLVHDCFEKRNSIKFMKQKEKILADGTTPDDHNGHGCSVDPTKHLAMAKEPSVWIEHIAFDAVTYEVTNIPNPQATRIVKEILPKALELYLKKSRDYGGNVMDRFELGEKAAIPDMARKFGKLIDAIWRDKPLQFEQPEEILMDLLGHILIILDQRAEAANGGESVGK